MKRVYKVLIILAIFCLINLPAKAELSEEFIQGFCKTHPISLKYMPNCEAAFSQRGFIFKQVSEDKIEPVYYLYTIKKLPLHLKNLSKEEIFEAINIGYSISYDNELSRKITFNYFEKQIYPYLFEEVAVESVKFNLMHSLSYSINSSNAEILNEFIAQKDSEYISKILNYHFADTLERRKANTSEYQRAYQIIANETIGEFSRNDISEFDLQVLKKMFLVPKDSEMDYWKAVIAEKFLKMEYHNLNYSTQIVKNANKNNYQFILAVLENDDVDYKKLEKFLKDVEFDKDMSEVSFQTYLKLKKNDLINYKKVSQFNKYSEFRNKLDPNFELSEYDIAKIRNYDIKEKAKIKAVQKALKADSADKMTNIEKELDLLVDKKITSKRRAQKAKEALVETPVSSVKCFINPHAHLDNYFSNTRNNTAFAIGLLNPINAIATAVMYPFKKLLEPFEGLH